MNGAQLQRRLLGIDFGRARIGVAISDELQFLAHPLETIPAVSLDKAAARISSIVQEKDVDLVVVGLPRHMNGSLGASAEEAQAFAEKLRPLLSCKVITWDERLSTVAAHRALQSAGKKSKQTKNYVDQVAAQMILQGYLDSLQRQIAPSD
ncbi:MAG: putative pre6S rRNA nuclease [Verrucomicrobiota bacterium]|jgi:putative Holliday junction resolvase